MQPEIVQTNKILKDNNVWYCFKIKGLKKWEIVQYAISSPEMSFKIDGDVKKYVL